MQNPSHKERKVDKMQTTMTLETCCRCGQAIGPDEPYMQSASVDIDAYSRQAVSSPVTSYHLSGRCYEDRTAAERARVDTLLAA